MQKQYGGWEKIVFLIQLADDRDTSGVDCADCAQNLKI
jgi:hypothetical protein